MVYSRSAHVSVVFTLVLIRYSVSANSLDMVYTHCTQTARNALHSTPKTIIPLRTNASDVLQPMSEVGHMILDLCPNKSFVKFSWNINQTGDYKTKLCYKMKSVQNEIVMDTVCFNLRVNPSNYSISMDCWFPMEFIDSRPVITAWTLSTNTAMPSFYGSLDTDLGNTCKDMCEVVAMNIGSQINCHENASITYDISTVVQHLSFDAIDRKSCQNGISTFKGFTSHLEYQLNCSFEGSGYVKVLYRTHGKYCLKYQMVRVVCSNVSGMTPVDASDDTHSFGTFLTFGIVCIVIIAAVFFATVFVVQLLYEKSYHGRHSDPHHRRFSDQHHHRIAESGLRHVSIKRDEYYPLNTFRPQPSGSRQTATVCADVLLSNKASPRQRSASMSSDKISEAEHEKLKLLNIPMRRSITMALLEETDPFYKKKIMFLPIPFDHYTNDVTKILKSVFMDEGGIPSQCCFDRKIYQEYMESDKFKWIENVLDDHDKILVFLCFTSLSVERIGAKRESMAEFILENLLFTKVKSHRLCKVLLLHLIDSPENVQEHNIGDSFHISDSKSYGEFVRNVLSFCGRKPEENPEFINRLSNCEASKHLLQFIGIKYMS